MDNAQSIAEKVGMTKPEQFSYGLELFRVLMEIRLDRKQWAKVQARVEENRRKAALAN